jgi:penicillin-binding protein 1A
MKKTAYFWRKGLWALVSLSFLFLVLASILYIYLQSQLPNVESLKTVQLQVPLRIYTRDGLLMQEYGEKRRIPVNYEDIPPTLVHAVLATEDQRFFEHPGVDIFGLGRAAVRMIQTGTKSQGGSTITMQVARNFFLERKKTFLRKFNEILLAIKIDQQLSKEKILELYLNKIYLGNRAYGVGSAAQVYYGKTLKELTLAQLAMIAGLPQAPSSQNPIANPLAAKKRRDHVLERLLEEKYITEDQYHEAIIEPLTAKYHGATLDISAPYVSEMIRQSLYEHFGPDAYTKGYKVYTTINGSLQKTANKVVEENLIAYDKRHGYRGPVANIGSLSKYSSQELHKQLSKYPIISNLVPAIITEVSFHEAKALLKNGDTVTLPWKGLSWARPALKKGWYGKKPKEAQDVVSLGDVVYLKQQLSFWQLTQIPDVEAALVALNPNNGAIEALVGGYDFVRSKYNRATQSSRQPGSCFKPFVYAAALSKGYTLSTMINDAPIVVDDPSQPNLWRPQNSNKKFNGPMRLKEGLIKSRNMVSIRILDDIGIDYAIDFITKFGFPKTSLPRGLSLALGSLSVTPLELASAYAVFANGGFKIEPYLIDRITDEDGDTLLQAKPVQACGLACDKDTIDPDLLAPQVLSSDVAFLMDTALKDVVQHGTARAAKVLNRQDIGGKTGTTNDQVDTWFAGYQNDLVVTTWIGHDSPTSVHEYAAQLALPLWIDFMRVALKDKPEAEVRLPENVIALHINPKTGLIAPENGNETVVEYFREEDVPVSDDDSTTVDVAPMVDTDEHLF